MHRGIPARARVLCFAGSRIANGLLTRASGKGLGRRPLRCVRPWVIALLDAFPALRTDLGRHVARRQVEVAFVRYAVEVSLRDADDSSRLNPSLLPPFPHGNGRLFFFAQPTPRGRAGFLPLRVPDRRPRRALGRADPPPVRVEPKTDRPARPVRLLAGRVGSGLVNANALRVLKIR